jgi:hypothetical protein
MSNSFSVILENIAKGFADPFGVEIVFKRLTGGREMNDPEIVGMGMHADELLLAHLEGFVDKVLNDPQSEFYHLLNSDFVYNYLYYFDVKPSGPDVMKYIWAFGKEFERYAGALGERHLVTSMIRAITVRLLRNAAAASNSRNEKPPAVMVDKIYKICHDTDKTSAFVGQYGPYMLFKTWALA